MESFLRKTFGGLSKQYFFRQLFFGAVMLLLFTYPYLSDDSLVPDKLLIAALVVNTLLYPYARFVYETIIDFILGNNSFLVNGIFFIFVKILTMFMCWLFALLLAPVGLVFLYFKNARLEVN